MYICWPCIAAAEDLASTCVSPFIPSFISRLAQVTISVGVEKAKPAGPDVPLS